MAKKKVKKQAKKKKTTKKSKEKTSKKATTKKKVTKTKKSKELEPMKLKGKLFLEYRAALAELHEKQLDLRLKETEFNIEKVKPESQPLMMKWDAMQQAVQELAKTQVDFKEIQRRIAEKFGINVSDFKNYTINQYAGMVVFTPSKEE